MEASEEGGQWGVFAVHNRGSREAGELPRTGHGLGQIVGPETLFPPELVRAGGQVSCRKDRVGDDGPVQPQHMQVQRSRREGDPGLPDRGLGAQDRLPEPPC